MHIPRYWAKAEKRGSSPETEHDEFRAWASSEISEEDAYRLACERLERIERHYENADFSDDYAYGPYPTREELLEEFYDDNDETVAMITRNRYGCRILNTARCMFLDVDIPPQDLFYRIMAWLRGWTSGNAETILANLRTGLKNLSRGSFRIYRTAAGFRVIGTDREYEPMSAEVQILEDVVGADGSYMKLCRIQKCFRARISPKSWRLGIKRPAFKFPCETTEKQSEMEAWVAKYEQQIGGHATCHFLEGVC